MTPTLLVEAPQEVHEYSVELESYRPPNCINTDKLLKRIAEEGEDAWYGEEDRYSRVV